MGIGLFIAFIGLQNAGIVINNDATLVGLGDVTGGPALVALIGLVLTGVLLALKVKGALLIGIIGTTIIGLPFGVTSIPQGWSPVKAPDAPLFFAFEFDKIFTLDFIVVLFTFLFVDIFDTIGTLVGVTTQPALSTKTVRSRALSRLSWPMPLAP